MTYLAFETKFLAVQLKSWQTAYAFDALRGLPQALDDHSPNRRNFLETAAQLNLEIHRIRDHISEPSEIEVWKLVSSHFQKVMEIDQTVVQAYRSQDPTAIARANGWVSSQESQYFKKITSEIEELIVSILNLSHQSLQEAREANNIAYILMFLSGGCVLATLRLFVKRANAFMHRQIALLKNIDKLARTDGLTGIPNRRVWDEELPKMMERCQTLGDSFTLILLDLDHFKHFNDQRGHQAGDQLLKAVAQAWNQQLRTGDLLARYGGEEFGLLLFQCTPDNALQIIQRLKRVMPEEQTFSAGIAAWDGLDTADTLIEKADKMLYLAKQKGRDRAEIFPRETV